MKSQGNPDCRAGHIERERIRARWAAEVASARWRRNHKPVPKPVPFTRVPILIDDIKECPAYIHGCNLHNCRACKERVWELACPIVFAKK
jgi:hypothetical protein